MNLPSLRSTVASCGAGAVAAALAVSALPRPAEQEVSRLQGSDRITLRSQVLGEERMALVHVPEGYGQSSMKYPVLYVLDAEYFFPQVSSAVQFLSELGYEGGQHPIPAMIVVGVVGVDRDRDFTPTHAPEQSQGRLTFPTSGGAQSFQKFFEQELVPLIDTRYRTSSHRILSGWSLGGLFTVYTYLERPDLFARHLAISPSLWWDDSTVVKQTRGRLERGDAMPPNRLVITLGALEGGDMDGAVRRNFVPLLSDQPASTFDFEFVQIPGENHFHVPYKAYYDGLSALYADWLVPSDVLGKGLATVEDFFENLSQLWGYRVDVPLSVYRSMAVTLPDIDDALDAARHGVTQYPYSSLAHYSLGRLQQMRGDTAAAIASLQSARRLELERPVPQSEWLRAIRDRLRRLEPR